MKKRILYFDILNILSCIAVIALHHNSRIWKFEVSNGWRLSLFIECFFYWAVPIFLMISGANLLNYREKYDTKVFLKKRVLKTVIPWFVWSLIVLIWKIKTSQLVLEEKTLTYLLDLILNYKVENVYWFFGALFACYLAIPVFSMLVKERKILWYIVGMNFIFLSCVPILQLVSKIQFTLDVPVVGSLIIYVILGYLLATEELGKKKRYTIYVLGIVGFAFRYIVTYALSVKNNEVDMSVKGYTMFHAVLLSVAVFVWAKHVKWDKYLSEKIQKIISQISTCSFGIYLIHRIVMYYEMNILELNTRSFVWTVLFVPVTYIISLSIVYVLKKIPGIKIIVP